MTDSSMTINNDSASQPISCNSSPLINCNQAEEFSWTRMRFWLKQKSILDRRFSQASNISRDDLSMVSSLNVIAKSDEAAFANLISFKVLDKFTKKPSVLDRRYM